MHKDCDEVCTRDYYKACKDPAPEKAPRFRVVGSPLDPQKPVLFGALDDPVPGYHWAGHEAKAIAGALNMAIDKFAEDNGLRLLDRAVAVAGTELPKILRRKLRRRGRLVDAASKEHRRAVIATWLRASDDLYKEFSGLLAEEVVKLEAEFVRVLREGYGFKVTRTSGYWRIDPRSR